MYQQGPVPAMLVAQSNVMAKPWDGVGDILGHWSTDQCLGDYVKYKQSVQTLWLITLKHRPKIASTPRLKRWQSSTETDKDSCVHVLQYQEVKKIKFSKPSTGSFFLYSFFSLLPLPSFPSFFRNFLVPSLVYLFILSSPRVHVWGESRVE